MPRTKIEILVVDLGNTRMKAARFRGGVKEQVVVAAHGDILALRSLFPEAPPQLIGVGSVAGPQPELLRALRDWAPVVELDGGSPSPVVNPYGRPTDLGVDRLANAVAATVTFPGRAVLAVDAGTCITYDMVTADGTYRGGAITPGMAMRAKAMHAYSARLPLVEPEDDAPLLGTATQQALASGILHGVVHEVRGYMAACAQQWPGLAVVLTGGDALRIVRGLKSGIFAHPDLTLEGLHVLLTHTGAHVAAGDRLLG